jgi:hypothetical protein
METTNEIKKAAVIAAAAEQVRSLLETHYDAMRKAAEESFVDDETQAEPKAKASFTIEWDALAMAPTVTVKVGWSVRFKDESESVVDPLQAKLDIGGAE